jgi:hypothetical protein
MGMLESRALLRLPPAIWVHSRGAFPAIARRLSPGADASDPLHPTVLYCQPGEKVRFRT